MSKMFEKNEFLKLNRNSIKYFFWIDKARQKIYDKTQFPQFLTILV